MIKLNRLFIPTIAALACISLGNIPAGALTFSSYTSSASFSGTTDISNQLLTVQKFDSSLGALHDVAFTFEGTLEAMAGYENLSNKAADISMNIKGDLSLKSSSNDPLITLSPEIQKSDYLPKFDGKLGFGSNSFAYYYGLTNTKSYSVDSTDTNVLAYFSKPGGGNLDFLFNANATSKFVGPGNMLTLLFTGAQGKVDVTYNYQPVPEASSLLGLGGLMSGGLLALRLRRRNR